MGDREESVAKSSAPYYLGDESELSDGLEDFAAGLNGRRKHRADPFREGKQESTS